jgi:Nickel responsive protein SCO4226-like
MTRYLLELYLPRGQPLEEAFGRARQAADAVSNERTSIRYRRSLYLAEDETCFHVFEAPSREALLEAAARVGLAHARIREAVESQP